MGETVYTELGDLAQREFTRGSIGAEKTWVTRDYDEATDRLSMTSLVHQSGDGSLTSRHYDYDDAGNILSIRDRPTDETRPADVQCFDYDQIAVDAEWGTVQQRRFTAFGQLRSGTEAWPGEKGFVGGTVDDSIGLTQLGARSYDAELGRFVSVDPLMDPGDAQMMQGYAYANNSPVTLSDSTGKWWRWDGWDLPWFESGNSSICKDDRGCGGGLGSADDTLRPPVIPSTPDSTTVRPPTLDQWGPWDSGGGSTAGGGGGGGGGGTGPPPDPYDNESYKPDPVDVAQLDAKSLQAQDANEAAGPGFIPGYTWDDLLTGASLIAAFGTIGGIIGALIGGPAGATIGGLIGLGVGVALVLARNFLEAEDIRRLGRWTEEEISKWPEDVPFLPDLPVGPSGPRPPGSPLPDPSPDPRVRTPSHLLRR